MLPRPRSNALPASLLAAALLVAAPPRATAQAAPQAPAHSVWFDAGALIDDQVRAGVEAVRLGRFTAGLAIAFSSQPHPRYEYVYPLPYAADGSALPQCDPRMLSLCAEPIAYYGTPDATSYRAWSFDLAVRYYPEQLAFRNGDTQLMVYAGAFAGYRWRTWEEHPFYYWCPPGYACPAAGVRDGQSPVRAPTDSSIVVPLYPPQYPIAYAGTLRHTLKGLEPGLEVGVRLLPVGPLFFEAGGRFTLVVVDDPLQRVRPGDVEARLVLAAGLAW